MTKNPILNALAATAYIVSIAALMFYGTQQQTGPDSVLAPVAVLSLLTFSAAVMAYLFFYQPIMMLLDGKKKAAINFFLQTLAAFGVVTALALGLLFSGIL